MIDEYAKIKQAIDIFQEDELPLGRPLVAFGRRVIPRRPPEYGRSSLLDDQRKRNGIILPWPTAEAD